VFVLRLMQVSTPPPTIAVLLALLLPIWGGGGVVVVVGNQGPEPRLRLHCSVN
jgi:hypothetical protein